jgi:hypothetical protein
MRLAFVTITHEVAENTESRARAVLDERGVVKLHPGQPDDGAVLASEFRYDSTRTVHVPCLGSSLLFQFLRNKYLRGFTYFTYFSNYY